jgi:serine protease
MRVARPRAAVVVAVASIVLCAFPALRANAAPTATTHGAGPKRYPTVQAAHARRAHTPKPPRAAAGRAAFTTPATNQLHYGGGVDGIGVTTGAPAVYLVFWGKQWGTATPAGSTNFSNDPSGVAPRLQQLFQGIGTNGETWSGVMTQYCEGVAKGATTCDVSAPHVGYPLGGPLAGVWYDNNASAPSSASAHQIAVEAVSAAGHFGNTTPASNRNAQYFIVSPTGTHPDGFNSGANWCAWHDYNADPSLPPASSNYGDVAFTNMPYLPDAGSSCGSHFVNSSPIGAIDGVTIVAGHEYAETITDQNPLGGWFDANNDENADKCAWINPGSSGGAQNVDFANGSFAMQSTWSNDTNECLISHDVFGVPGQDNFALSLASNEATVSVGGATATTVSTTTVSGNPQFIALSATGVPDGATVSFDTPTISSGDSTTLTFTTTDAVPPGAYNITVTATGTVTHTATFTALVIGPPVALANGEPATNISAPRGFDQFRVLDVPAGQDSLTFTITGGSGDADLYVRQGQAPSATEYDCRPYLTGNEEACSFDTPAPGTWYVMLDAYADFSDVTLTGTYATVAATATLQDGVAATGIAGATGSRQYWQLDVPPGQASLTFLTNGGGGDADLYVRFDAKPTLATFDCVSGAVGNTESCTIANPAAGSWFVMLSGYSAYSGATLFGAYNMPTTALKNGGRVRNVGGPDGTDLFWKITVPANARILIVTLGGGGNGDLYVRFATRPTSATFDCASTRTRGTEKCSLANPPTGDYYVMVEAVHGFARGTLTAKYRMS